MKRVVLDAMGSDKAPCVEVRGALRAIGRRKDLQLFLVGNKSLIEKEFKRIKFRGKVPFEIIHTDEKIDMHEKASLALKKKRSSIALGLSMVKEGEADAFVSAGNTGAIMAFSLSLLGRIKGVRRPAIGVMIPTLMGTALLLDVGANAQVKPQDLVQFAVMGSLFVQYVKGVELPRVGLLSIGEEEGKGNPLVIEAKSLLGERKDLNFIGFVEGNHILEGRAEVVVTDGFTGNVILKFGEGSLGLIKNLLTAEIKRNPFALMGYILLRPTFVSLKKKFDYEEYGGAPLLGVNGVVLISHGRSTPKAIMNAVMTALDFAEKDVNRHIEEKFLER